MASSVTQKALFSGVTTLVVFGAAELGLRAAGWPQPQGRFAHNEPFWVVDPDLKQKATPHKETGGSFTVTTDEKHTNTGKANTTTPEEGSSRSKISGIILTTTSCETNRTNTNYATTNARTTGEEAESGCTEDNKNRSRGRNRNDSVHDQRRQRIYYNEVQTEGSHR